MSTAFYPQTDGQTERMNRTLEEMLRNFVSPSFQDWDRHLPCCEFAMNNAFSESIKTTPFFLNYGRHPRSPTDFVPKPFEGPGMSFASNMRSALERAQNCMQRAQERQSRYANKKRRDVEFGVGDFVYLDSKNITLPTAGAHRLGHRFIGPYKILKRVGVVSHEFELPESMRMHDVFHVSLLRPYHHRGEHLGAPPALLLSGEVEYEVQEVLKHFDDADNERWYEVRWDDGSISSIPEKHTSNCWDRVKEYLAKQGINAQRPPKLGKRGRGSIKRRQVSGKIPLPSPSQAVPDMVKRLESQRDLSKQTETEATRRSSRVRLKRLLCLSTEFPVAPTCEHGLTFPKLYSYEDMG